MNPDFSAKSRVGSGFIAVGCFVSVLLLGLAGLARAGDWPEGYVVYAESPDHHYGILVPSHEAAENDEALGQTNYFADLQKHRLLGKINGADYFENQNHRHLQMIWPEDANWGVVQYDDRFGFSSIAIFEPKDGPGRTGFVQTEIGQRIQKALAGAMKAKGDPDAASGGDATPYYRFDHGKIFIWANSTSDPKQLDTKHAHFGLFRGTYDVTSKKWLSVEARPLTFEEYENSDVALEDIDETLAHREFVNAEDRYQSLDETMNTVYGFLRTALPAARFAAVKKEQIEWLKKRDAAATNEAKCALVQAQIKTLQELLW